MESDGFHASVDHMGEYHPQYFDGDKQAICIFCLKVSDHVVIFHALRFLKQRKSKEFSQCLFSSGIRTKRPFEESCLASRKQSARNTTLCGWQNCQG